MAAITMATVTYLGGWHGDEMVGWWYNTTITILWHISVFITVDAYVRACVRACVHIVSWCEVK